MACCSVQGNRYNSDRDIRKTLFNIQDNTVRKDYTTMSTKSTPSTVTMMIRRSMTTQAMSANKTATSSFIINSPRSSEGLFPRLARDEPSRARGRWRGDTKNVARYMEGLRAPTAPCLEVSRRRAGTSTVRRRAGGGGGELHLREDEEFISTMLVCLHRNKQKRHGLTPSQQAAQSCRSPKLYDDIADFRLRPADMCCC